MIFWIDKNGIEYYKSEIDDKYLLNIAKSISRGYYNFDHIDEERIDNIFEECYNRGLMTLEEAHEKSRNVRDKLFDRSYPSDDLDYEDDKYFNFNDY